MGESSFYVDEAYRILMECEAHGDLSADARILAVMASWDGRKFDGNPYRELVAKMALCHIGLAWHSDSYPYPLQVVTGRLLEFMPELGSEIIEARTLRDIIGGRHASQYASRRGCLKDNE